MKKSIKVSALFLIITVFMSCGSSRVAIATPDIEIKNIENKSDKNSNFIKANEWMVQSFNNAESVIQFKDKDAGIVKGKYAIKEGYTSTSAYVMSTPTYFSIITLRVKDNAARIEISAPSGMYTQKDIYGGEMGFTKEMFIIEAKKIIQKFEVYMKKKSSNDNW